MREHPDPYRPAWWLPNAHLATMWGKFFRARPPIDLTVERVATPDDDFVELVHANPTAAAGAPRLLLLHGLEGGLHSHYALPTMQRAIERGWAPTLLLFRGCGAEMNRARRFYHSGETQDLDLVVRHLMRRDPDAPLLLAGVSLGGNVLLKWLGEQGERAPDAVRGAVAVSVPFDLAVSARRIQLGFARLYQWDFLRSLRRKALAKLAVYNDLVPRDRLLAVRTLFEFDDVLTAPLHGFVDAADYYARSSSMGFLSRIRRPALLLVAADDPFVDDGVLAAVRELAQANPWLQLEIPPRGGHVGFVMGPHPFAPSYYVDRRIVDALAAMLDPDERTMVYYGSSEADSSRHTTARQST
ncbi:MAG TPA: hydrolase [Gemmatimonadaceae bacterium]|nr:hydrolase [Gemmatimonadaceae bacterium]